MQVVESTGKNIATDRYVYDQPGFGENGRIGFLLVHGLGGTPVELRFVAQGLTRAGFAVYCPLLEGHGGTEAELNATTWQDWYDSVAAAHEELRARCDMVVVGGLSTGALLALHLAAERPDDVAAAVLFAPTLWPNGWAVPRALRLMKYVPQKQIANYFSFAETAPYGIKDERIRQFALDSLQGEGRSMKDVFGRSGSMLWELRSLRNSVRKELGAVKQPTLILHPRNDDQADLSNTTQIQRELGGLVDVVVLDDSYHMVTLDRQRTLVADRAVEYGQRLVAKLQPREAATPATTQLAAE
ncbi:MAG: alpha/beta fold hydrolase [Hyphomicrobium sp.]|uniref:alpha/beta hydrolase n=1 Tax=Hyphomicrobium sp. CS1BSMeth3 TaxID=1892844 RepID=UPI0009F8AAFC|nr:alpha/beta fold hydrolase [Hyphomicrobium sp. CS1BSMeth3]MBN9261668.1 alpha/beta fold hydrolase [Hyphomicrobium sp.]MBN9264466.1 alpha/beta fold hydrolase [Hyphomicrobium sp.]MBN9277019.1 alpha/beta fold hydrolase [Hyphomicrobium sp.]